MRNKSLIYRFSIALSVLLIILFIVAGCNNNNGNIANTKVDNKIGNNVLDKNDDKTDNNPLQTLSKVASLGDTVSVIYTAYMTNGTVIDTNDPEIIAEYNLPKKPFAFNFTIGKHQVIPGFEKAVIGMKEGEEKSVTLPPEDAYGVHDKSKLVIKKIDVVFPRKAVIPITFNITKEEFKKRFYKDAVTGTIVKLKDRDYYFMVNRTTNNSAIVRAIVNVNETYPDTTNNWNFTILNVSSDTMTVFRNPYGQHLCEWNVFYNTSHASTR